MTEREKRIIRALRALAGRYNQLENVPQDIKLKKGFRSRRKLIEDILIGQE